MEMNKLTPVTIPIGALENFIYSMNVADSRALSALSRIEGALAELNQALEMRNQLIDEFRAGGLDVEDYTLRYLGQFKEDGSVDTLYSSTMDAIEQYTDDLIFFSVYVVERLKNHSKALRGSLGSWRESTIPKIDIDLTPARTSGLVPEDVEYESWLRGFQGDD
jgi:hypothetical protein